MNIFISCLQSLKPQPIPAYDFWEPYFKNGIEEAGYTWCEAPTVDWAEAIALQRQPGLSEWRTRTWEAVVETIKREHQRKPIDMFLGYLYPFHVDEAAIKEIQKLGIPCVNFFCDNVREFETVPKSYHCFDLHWVPEFEAMGMYAAAGLKAVNLPMPCWVAPEHRSNLPHENEEISFIGSRDDYRQNMLGRAIRAGLDLSIYGGGWKKRKAPEPAAELRSLKTLTNQVDFIRERGLRQFVGKLKRRNEHLEQPEIPERNIKGLVPAADFPSTLRDSRVTIGINGVLTLLRPLTDPFKYSRLRDLEAPMHGACYLAERTEGLARMYDIGTEIECFDTPEELAEKAKELSNDSDRRKHMRMAGQRRALAEHSIPASLRRVIDSLGLQR